MQNCAVCKNWAKRFGDGTILKLLIVCGHINKCYSCQHVDKVFWQHFITMHPEDYALLLLKTGVE
jgi:hypothetical protein